MKNIFLSDLHIGVDAVTNLYKKKSHEPGLKAVLKYIQDNCEQVRDVVILGDWLDLWMYSITSAPRSEYRGEPLLPTAHQIIHANPNVFTHQADGSGDFVSCLDSIQGNFCYINGNHDITVTRDDINGYFRPLSRMAREVNCIDCSSSVKGYVSGSGDIYGEHGHWYSMVCRPYSPVKLPIGYYITRAGMQGEIDTRKPLPPIDVKKIKKFMKHGNLSFCEAMLTFMGISVGVDLRHLFFILPDGKKVSAVDVADSFPGLSVNDDDFLTVDVGGSLDDNAEKVLSENKFKVVIFGHTHLTKMVQDLYSKTVYVNSGFMCATSDSGSDRPVSTFVEVEDSDGVAPYTVSVKAVDSSCNISSLCSFVV